MDKNFKRVQFGCKKGNLLTNSRIVNFILDRLERYYKLELFKPFNKVIKPFNTSNIEEVSNFEYLVSYNITKPMSYIYLTKYKGITFCYYIVGTERCNAKIYSTLQRFGADLFDKEMILEGYILDNIFLVNDLVVHEGHTVSKPLEDRIKIINNILNYKYQPDPVLDNYKVVLKDYVEYPYIMSLCSDYMIDISYKDSIEGVIFSPLGACDTHLLVNEVSVKHNVKPIKTKSQKLSIVENPKKHKICFLVKNTGKPDVYHLYLRTGKGNETKYYDIASVPDKESSSMLKRLVKTQSIMICKYDNRDHMKRWQPLMTSNRDKPDTIHALR